MKAFRLWLFATAVGFYTTFVLQVLWNWFAVGSLNVRPILYWQMYGLNLLVQLVIERSTFDEETQWRRAFLLMYTSVPADKKADVDDEIESENDRVWLDAGVMVFGRILTNSATLVIGWVIHVLAA